MKIFNKYLHIYKYLHVEAKAAFWYTICNVLQKGISFLVVPLYVRILTTAEYGRYAIFLSWKDILIIFATFNLFYGVYTKSIIEFSDDRDRYTSCMQGLCTVITTVFATGYVFISYVHGTLSDYNISVLILLLLYFYFVPAYMFWVARQRVEYKYISMVAVTLLVSVLIPCVSLILLLFSELRETAVIVGYLSVQIVFGGIFYIINFLKGKTFYIHKYWISGLKFNIPLIPYYLSTMVLNQSDRIMIERYDNAEKAGIYSLAYQIAFMVNVISDAINASLTPWFYRQLKQKKYQSIKRTSSTIIVFVLALIVLIIFIAPDIVRLVGTNEYYEAIWIIPSVCVSVYFIFCYNLICNTEFYYDMPYFITITTLTGAAANICLNRICIPKYGYVAAGYTTAISYFIVFVMHCVVYRHIKRRNMEGESSFSMVFLISSCIGLLFFSVVCVYLYNFGSVVRYVIVFAIIMAGIIRRKDIVKYFSFFRDEKNNMV